MAKLVPGAKEQRLPNVTHYDFLGECTQAGKKVVPQCAKAGHQEEAHEAALGDAVRLFQTALQADLDKNAQRRAHEKYYARLKMTAEKWPSHIKQHLLSFPNTGSVALTNEMCRTDEPVCAIRKRVTEVEVFTVLLRHLGCPDCDALNHEAVANCQDYARSAA